MHVAALVLVSLIAQAEGRISIPAETIKDDLAAMPRETIELAEEDGTKVKYEGVPLREVLKKAGVPFDKGIRGKWLASYVLASAKDGYQVVYSLGELDASFGNEKVLIVDKRDGKPLFGYQGPMRLVVAGDKAGARDVRMLEKLEVVRLRQ